MHDAKLKTFDSSNILNNLILKTPLTSNLPKCLIILCYRPHCNYKVYKHIFFLLFVIFHTCIGLTGYSCTINCFIKDGCNCFSTLCIYLWLTAPKGATLVN